jgi:hypothetical protein
MKKLFQETFKRMSDAIRSAYPDNPHMFSTIMDNIVYKPIFGKSSKKVKQMYNKNKNVSPWDYLPDTTLREMVGIMSFITEQLISGGNYYSIKELVQIERTKVTSVKDNHVFKILPDHELELKQRGRRKSPKKGLDKES